MRDSAKNLILLAATLVLCGSVAECGARWLRPIPDSPWQFDSDIGYEFRPRGNYGDDTLSREGFRSPDVPERRPPGVRRILVLGDSVAFSIAVRREESWSALLGERLNAAGIRCEVLNAGVPGYVSYQALRRLQRRGLKFGPDLVLVIVGWNDLGYSTLPEWHPNVNVSDLPFAWDYQARATLWGSRALGLIQGRFQRRTPAARYGGAATTRPPSGLPFNQEALEIYLENLESLRRAATGHDAVLGVIVWPTLLRLRPKAPAFDTLVKVTFLNFPLSWDEFGAWYGRYADALTAFGAAHPDVLLVDPRPRFESAPEGADLFRDIGHLTPAGERLLATAVDERVVPLLAHARLTSRRPFDEPLQPPQGVVPLPRDPVEIEARVVEPLRLDPPDVLAPAPVAPDEPGAGEDVQVLPDRLAQPPRDLRLFLSIRWKRRAPAS